MAFRPNSILMNRLDSRAFKETSAQWLDYKSKKNSTADGITDIEVPTFQMI